MEHGSVPAQESRTEKVAIAVTKSEKDAIETVAKVRRIEGGVSQLLRERPFAEVVEEGHGMLDRLAGEFPAEKAS